MAKKKSAIAFCPKSRQYYHLALAPDGRTVSAFTIIDGKESGSTAPTVPPLVTSSELRPCPRCGSRNVKSCSCLRTHVTCETGVGYRFHCIYCDQLQIIHYER